MAHKPLSSVPEQETMPNHGLLLALLGLIASACVATTLMATWSMIHYFISALPVESPRTAALSPPPVSTARF